MELPFDKLPLPAVHFSADLEFVEVNSAYEKEYGDELLSRHREQLLEGEGPARSQLGDDRFLVCFNPELETLSFRDSLIREATQMAQVGAWEYDVASGEIRWSDEVYAIHQVGLDFEPTLDKVFDFYPPDAREHLAELVDKAIETGQDYYVELPLVTGAGQDIWIRARGHPEFADGKCFRLSGAVQEVTEDRKNRDQLAEVLERFAYAQESAAFGVWDFDPGTGSLHWDEAMFPLYDVNPRNFRGRFEDWADTVLPEDLPGATAELRKAMEGRHEFDTAFRIRLQDGGTRWIKATAHISRTEGGQASRLVGFNYDITSIKRAEEQLRESLVQLEEKNIQLGKLAAASQAANQAKTDFLANMSHEIRTPMNGVVGMASLLLETELTSQQRDSVDIIRKSADALLQLINDLLDFSKVEAGAVKLDEQNIDIRDAVDDLVEFLAIEAQGKGLLFHYTVESTVPLLVRVDAGRLRQILINLVGNAVKYTDEGRVSLRLQSQEDALVFRVRDTGPGISDAHLATIFAPFSRGDDRSVAGGTGLGLAICQRLAKLMQGEVMVESEVGRGSEFVLRLPFERATESFQHNWSLEERRFAITGGEPADRAALREALAFLRAECGDREPELELVFAGEKPRFDSCGQVLVLSAAESSKFKDYQQQGYLGAITYPFRSRPLEDTLTGILLQLPDSSRFKSTEERTMFTGHVLLVEDNLVNQKVAAKMLKKLGPTFQIAGNGVEALQMLEQFRFELVLMDLQMPEMDGLEATETLRSWPASFDNADIPVIALTAHATNDHRSRCFEAGMSDFLTKPLRVNDLRKVLRKWLPEGALKK